MKARRNLNPLPPLTPEGNAATRKPDSLTDADWWKRLLHLERKRHGQVETVLTRHIASLEQQVQDLRSAYFSNLTLRHTQEPK